MSSSPTLSVGALLKRHRRAAHLTQEELAERAGISVDTISALERGINLRPRRDTIDQLADALVLAPAQRAHLHAVAHGLLHERRWSGGPIAPSPSPSVPTPASASAGVVEHQPGIGATGAPLLSLPPFPSSPALSALVGREQERARLERHLAGEGPPVFLLAGEPGIGKSRLLWEVIHQAQAQGWVVLEGGCHRRSVQDPYVPVLTALEGRLRDHPAAQLRTELEGCAWLVRLLPELAERKLVAAPSWTLPPEQERRLMFAAVARYLGQVAGPLGTLLVLDDLQWAGADALDLLSSLLHTPLEAPLRLVGAYRSTEVRATDPLGALVTAWATAGLATRYPLGALAAPDARALLDTLLAADEEEPLAQPLREQVLARTGGVPYFLVSCAQALHIPGPAGLAAPAGTGAGAEIETGTGAEIGMGTGPSIPWNVAESIRQRVAALPPLAQDVLGIVAIAGDHTPLHLLLTVAGAWGQSQQEVIAALDAACQARLLVEEGTSTGTGIGTGARSVTYAFPHDLIHDVLLLDLSAGRRVALHQQVAEALEQLPERLREGRAAERAWHWREAGDAERALPAALQAGKQAEAVYAQQDAEQHYQTARDLARELGDQRQEAIAREQLGVVLEHLARFSQAREQLEAAFMLYQTTGEVEGQGRTLAQLGHVHAIHGDARTPERGIAWIVPRLPPLCARGLSLSGQARIYLALARLHMTTQSMAASLAAAERAVALAQQAHDDRLLAQAQMRRGTTLIGRERQEEGVVMLREVIPVLEANGDLEQLHNAHYNLARAYHLWGDFEQSRRANERAVELTERTGDLQGIALALMRQAQLAFLLGEWGQMRLACDRARFLLQHEGSLPYYAGLLLYLLGVLSLAEGQTETATDMLRQALARIAEHEGTSQMLSLWVATTLAEWDLLAGRAAAAQARLEPLRAGSGRFDLEEEARLEMLPRLAHAYVEQGAVEQAEALLAEVLTLATTRRRRFTEMDVRRVQGLLALRRERWQDAAQALDEALTLCQAMHTPYEEAKTLYYLGVLHRTRGKPTAARACWEAALAMLNRLGERLYATQVEQELARLEF